MFHARLHMLSLRGAEDHGIFSTSSFFIAGIFLLGYLSSYNLMAMKGKYSSSFDGIYNPERKTV